MSKKRVVVSLGHDALGYTTTEQWDAVKVTAKALADLVEADYQLTITHSNGPQFDLRVVGAVLCCHAAAVMTESHFIAGGTDGTDAAQRV